MKRILALVFVSSVLFNCSDEIVEKGCSTPATVRDLTGLDGCGFVFELEDGTRLEPVIILRCGTPPLREEITKDPLYNFEFIDGKKVFIDYGVADEFSSTCMSGQLVKITCLTEVKDQAGE